MKRLRNWLANQYWEWSDVLMVILGVVVFGLVSTMAALITHMLRFGGNAPVTHFWSSWALAVGCGLSVWGLAWVVIQLPEWARASAEKSQGIVDWLKEQALRELDEQFPADKETK